MSERDESRREESEPPGAEAGTDARGYSALELEKRAGLNSMRRLATGLLILMAAAYIALQFAPADLFWAGLLGATAEAAMIGALADWFAVTALFRRPLGLPIPHTAIVQNRKDAIADQFGRFVQENFLSETVVAERIRTLHPATRVAAWLRQEDKGALVAAQLHTGLVNLLKVVNDEDIRRLMERGVEKRIRDTAFAPLLGEMMELVADGEREKDLVDATVRIGRTLLQDADEDIRNRVTEETPWWFPKAVDRAIYHRIVRGVGETLSEIQQDERHPTRTRLLERMRAFMQELKHSPEMRRQEERFKEELLSFPAMREFIGSLWQDIRDALLKRADTGDGQLEEALRASVRSLADAVVRDPQLANRIDAFAENIACYLISRFGDETAELISGTIRGWDPKATAERIEVQIGRDLQFIRINGTLVGGLVGLLLFLATELLKLPG